MFLVFLLDRFWNILFTKCSTKCSKIYQKERSKKQSFLCCVQQCQRHQGLQFYRVKMYERASFLWSCILRRKTHSRVSSLLNILEHFVYILFTKCSTKCSKMYANCNTFCCALQKYVFASNAFLLQQAKSPDAKMLTAM